MKTKKQKPAPLMTREEFDQIILANEETLRRDPFGTEAYRKAYEELQKAWEDAKVQADAAKKKGTK